MLWIKIVSWALYYIWCCINKINCCLLPSTDHLGVFWKVIRARNIMLKKYLCQRIVISILCVENSCFILFARIVRLKSDSSTLSKTRNGNSYLITYFLYGFKAAQHSACYLKHNNTPLSFLLPFPFISNFDVTQLSPSAHIRVK